MLKKLKAVNYFASRISGQQIDTNKENTKRFIDSTLKDHLMTDANISRAYASGTNGTSLSQPSKYKFPNGYNPRTRPGIRKRWKIQGRS
jgi:hypothetical protein